MSTSAAPEFRSILKSAEAGQICFPRCGDCHRFHWYPMPLCPHCRSAHIEWRPVQGPAQLFSWTVVRHPFDAKLADMVPYVVGLVTFADAPGVRLITNIVDADAATLRIGMELEPVKGRNVAFENDQNSSLLSTFRPVAR